MVPITPTDTVVEAKLLQAHSALSTVASLKDVDMVVECNCVEGSENKKITSHFCTDKGLILVEK